MRPVFLHDKNELEQFFRLEPYLHLYELGDLDEFFWPYTSWIAAREGNAIRAVMLVYSGGGLPVILAIHGADGRPMAELLSLSAGQPLLPFRFYAHLSPGLAQSVKNAGYSLEFHGLFYKMGLLKPEKLHVYLYELRNHMPAAPQPYPVRRLIQGDASLLRQMYDDSYPGNWFDPRMLETGSYFGAWDGEKVVSAGGIHVYSPRYRAAALGNICTRPDYRGMGLGKTVTAHVCQSLLSEGIDTVGLNVRAGNEPALAAYRRLGFEVVAEYEEYLVYA